MERIRYPSLDRGPHPCGIDQSFRGGVMTRRATPPLVSKCRGRKGLPTPMPPPREVTGLHIPVVAFLNPFLALGWEFTHPATGEHREKRPAAKLKAMGAKPGWPDVTLISPEG